MDVGRRGEAPFPLGRGVGVRGLCDEVTTGLELGHLLLADRQNIREGDKLRPMLGSGGLQDNPCPLTTSGSHGNMGAMEKLPLDESTSNGCTDTERLLTLGGSDALQDY